MNKILLTSIILLSSLRLLSQDVQAFRYEIKLDEWYFLIGEVDSLRAKQEYDNRINEFPKFLDYYFTANGRLEVYWMNDSNVSHILLFQEDNSKYYHIDSVGSITKRKVYPPVEFVLSIYEKDAYAEVSGPNRGTTIFHYPDSNCLELEIPVAKLNDEFYAYFVKSKCVPNIIQTALRPMTYILNKEIELNKTTALFIADYLQKPKSSFYNELMERIKTCADKKNIQ